MASFDRSILRQPRWIAAIVVGLILCAAFVRAGVWQLDRLEERQQRNAVVEDRRESVERPFVGLIGQYGVTPADLTDRPVEITGLYRPDLEFFSVGRTYGDLQGTLVATPVEIADGRLVVIVRGIVPPTTEGPPAEGFEPPDGLVVVRGFLDDGEEPLRIGEPDPTGGRLESLSRVDLGFVAKWIEGDVLPVSVVLVAQEPQNPAGQPVPVPLAELTEGSHLGYAVQWFAFALIVAVGVGFLVWRAGRADPSDAESSG